MLPRTDKRLLAFVDAIRFPSHGSTAEGAAGVFVDWLRDDEPHSWIADTADVIDLYVNPPPLSKAPEPELSQRMRESILRELSLLRKPKQWKWTGWFTTHRPTINCPCLFPTMPARFEDIPPQVEFRRIVLMSYTYMTAGPYQQSIDYLLNQCLQCGTLYWGIFGATPPYKPEEDDSLRPLLVKWCELELQDIAIANAIRNNYVKYHSDGTVHFDMKTGVLMHLSIGFRMRHPHLSAIVDTLVPEYRLEGFDTPSPPRR